MDDGAPGDVLGQRFGDSSLGDEFWGALGDAEGAESEEEVEEKIDDTFKRFVAALDSDPDVTQPRDIAAEFPSRLSTRPGIQRTTTASSINSIRSTASSVAYSMKTPMNAVTMISQNPPLKSLPILPSPATITHLTLSQNFIESIDGPMLSTLVSCVSIDLSKNNLEALPEEIGKLKVLRELRVADNFLRSIVREVGECRALEVLDFGRNRIKVIGGCLLWRSSRERYAYPSFADKNSLALHLQTRICLSI